MNINITTPDSHYAYVRSLPSLDQGNIFVCFKVVHFVLFFFWWGDMREEDHLGDPNVDRRIISK
jgi:hypothetical protein